MENVDQVRVGQRFLLCQLGSGLQLAVVEILAQRRADGKADEIVRPGAVLAPWHGEIEMVSRAPRDRLRVPIAEAQLDKKRQRFEAVADGEVVIIGVGGPGLGPGLEESGEPALFHPLHLKLALAGQPVDGHGPSRLPRVAPEVDLAAVERAAAEGEQDGVAAAYPRKIVH